jgi:hypothetical protein
MARATGAGLAAAVILVLASAGCGAAGTAHLPVSMKPGAAVKPGAVAPVAVAPVTGVALSALLAAPAGFTADESRSYDSGDAPVSARPGIDPQRESCADWWAGSYYGPGDVGYAVKEFTGPDGTTVTVTVNLYRRGGGASVFDASVALHDRCAHFTYRDASDHLRYRVDVEPASPAGVGDRSETYDATESAGGEVFPTEVTFIEIGDASIGINQTGPAGSPSTRVMPPLTALIAALRAAGY